jgi:hypothetical protein
MSTIAKNKKRPQKPGLTRRVEAAGPAGEKLRQLVKKHPAPQQWYEESESNGKAVRMAWRNQNRHCAADELFG